MFWLMKRRIFYSTCRVSNFTWCSGVLGHHKAHSVRYTDPPFVLPPSLFSILCLLLFPERVTPAEWGGEIFQIFPNTHVTSVRLSPLWSPTKTWLSSLSSTPYRSTRGSWLTSTAAAKPFQTSGSPTGARKTFPMNFYQQVHLCHNNNNSTVTIICKAFLQQV